MKKRKIFIAVNLPYSVKKKLSLKKKDFLNIPAKWTRTENLHITVLFIGYIDEKNLSEVENSVRFVSMKNDAFPVKITGISFSPKENDTPKMIWANIEKSNELTVLRKEIENALKKTGIVFQSNEEVFAPHITLARINTWKFKSIDPEEIPDVDIDESIKINVNSIDLMESVQVKGGVVYRKIKEFSFQK